MHRERSSGWLTALTLSKHIRSGEAISPGYGMTDAPLARHAISRMRHTARPDLMEVIALLVFRPRDVEDSAALCDADGVSPLMRQLLAQRGIVTRAQADAFLHPSVRQLHDPMLMQNMSKVCARICEALEKRERICVYGDYDVDGVTSASIMSGYLRSLGGDVRVYIPSRHQEGYGLNIKALEDLTHECSLIISVDCGITSVQEAAYVQSLGRDIIVTDHHQLPPELPGCLCLDPLMGDYPFRKLCGAGVAMKVVQALGGVEALEPYWDLAALGTIADIVPLLDENRVITSIGLARMNQDMRPGLRALCRVAGMKQSPDGTYKVTSGNIAFQIAPRINAGGRMESAVQCVELLTSSDARRVEELAERLAEDNAQRQEQEMAMIAAAEKTLADADFTSFRAIIICGEGWNPGVVGLAASRLTEKYHYPSIVLSRSGDMCVGSCRSIRGVDIFAALSSCRDLFTRFGGHPQAAGLTIRACDLDKLVVRLNDYLRKNTDPRVYLPDVEYDCDIEPGQLTLDTARELELLAPTGFGNPAPLFRIQANMATAAPVGRDGAHLKAILDCGGVQLGAIGFRMGERAAEVRGARQDIIFSLSINSYMGVDRAQAELKAIGSVSPNADIARLEQNAERDYICYLDSILYNISNDAAHIREITPEQLAALLRRDAQGIVMVGETPSQLRKALIMLGGLGVTGLPDVSRGYPTDRRAFNALCLCPMGVPPKGYKYYVSLGGWLDDSIASQLERAGLAALRLKGASPSPALKPDDDHLREAYKYVSRNALTLAGTLDAQKLADMIAAGAGITPAQAIVTMHIFRELGLVSFTREARALLVPPMHKVNLSDSLIYRKLG